MSSICYKRLIASLFLLIPLAVQADAPAKAFSPPPAVTLRSVASGLSQPLFATHAGDASGRLFLVEKGGRIKVLKNGGVLATPFLDISGLVSTAGERGLLGLAFHPQFATNLRFFVFYTRAADGALRISSFQANPLSDVANPASEQEIITIAHPGLTNHNGGALAFGPDGYLYVGTGDGGGSGDPSNNAQNLNLLLGKILRLDVSGASGYAIPPGNPFVGTPGARGEIWAYGLRNPWRFSFDRSTGDFYIGDVGQDAVEEVNFQPYGSPGGQNYGWRVFEGSSCFIPPAGCSLANHTPPALTYGHNASGGSSITGGYVYRGRKSRALRGYYIYGDFISNRVWAAQREGATWSTSVLIAPPSALNGISSFGEDEAGELYVVSLIGGQVFAVDGPGPGSGVAFDVNADLRADLTFQYTDGTIGLWLMNGTVSPTITGLVGPGSGVTLLDVADFDGNGTADILWQYSGGYAISLMNGSTVTATEAIQGVDLSWASVATGDFNADGLADIVFKRADGTHAILIMQGTTAQRAFAILAAGGGWGVERVGDFNGDGKADVIVKHADGSHAILLIDGFGVSAVGGSVGPGSGHSVALLGDLNGDGQSDILWKLADGSSVAWLMKGVTVTLVEQLLPPGSGWTLSVAGDFDADGRSDLAIAYTDGSQAILLMNGTSIVSGALVIGPGTGWAAVAARDFDGDGRADLLLRHSGGTYAVGLVNGVSMPSAFGVVGPGWSLVP